MNKFEKNALVIIQNSVFSKAELIIMLLDQVSLVEDEMGEDIKEFIEKLYHLYYDDVHEMKTYIKRYAYNLTYMQYISLKINFHLWLLNEYEQNRKILNNICELFNAVVPKNIKVTKIKEENYKTVSRDDQRSYKRILKIF